MIGHQKSATIDSQIEYRAKKSNVLVSLIRLCCDIFVIQMRASAERTW